MGSINPDWVPGLRLRHDKLKESNKAKEKQQQRAQRITERRKGERECEEQEAMKRKAVKVDEPGERIKDFTWCTWMKENWPWRLRGRGRERTQTKC